MMRSKYFKLAMILLIVIAIPITIFAFKRISDMRSRADSTTPEYSFSSDNSIYGLGMTFPVDLYLDTKNQPVVLVDVKISFDPNVVTLEKFIPEKVLSTQLSSTDVLPTENGSFEYKAIDSIGAPVSGKVKIGSFLFRANGAGNSMIKTDYGVIGNDLSINQLNESFASINIVDPSNSSGINTTASTPNPTSPTITPTANCDTNGDNITNNDDFLPIKQQWLGGLLSTTADCNKDGVVNGLDFQIWKNLWILKQN